MSLIAKTGRSSKRIRLMLTALYAILLLGAFTMIYPFMLMLAGSTKSAVDEPASVIIPRFLYNDEDLYRKFTEGFFNESLEMMRISLGTNTPTFRNLDLPKITNTAAATPWFAFLEQAQLPFYMYQPSFVYAPVSRGTIPHNLRALKKQLADLSDGNIGELNRTIQSDFIDWNSVFVIPRNYLERRIQPEATPLLEHYNRFKKTLPPSECYTFSVPEYYRWVFLRALYPDDITRYNQTHGTEYAAWNDIEFHAEYPAHAHPATQKDWTIFTREIVNALWIRSSDAGHSEYQQYLQAKYISIDNLNRIYGTDHDTFDRIPLYVPEQNAYGIALTDWTALVAGWKDPLSGRTFQLPDTAIQFDTLENRYRAYLKSRFESLTSFNDAVQGKFTSWNQVTPPRQEALLHIFSTRKTHWRLEFLVRNYISVMEYIILHGRALMNTMIYCSLAILLALIVNPLAAYALSRYKPPTSYTILLFLMMTMAFPPMVTQIPVFLMLRQFNLLNTFWALVLPSIANGFSIFLLKGFFDSLPSDLYDSAALDGAGEFTIFWHITISLSKPILAVIALNAFTLAYSNFMMALLICQDEKMWTLMPWLYQLQQRSGQGVIFASLLIAAIPTFIVFSLCQNIIMRGIVIPVEK